MEKIFLAAPFTHNFDNGFLADVTGWLEGRGYSVVVPHAFADDNLEKLKESVERDISLLESSDILLADVSKPSHGVGIEIFHAHKSGKRVILIMQSGTKLSGMARQHAHHVLEYSDFSDLKAKLGEVLHI